MSFTSAIITAFIFDLIFGDPKWLPHPVRWMGVFITRYENAMRLSPVPLLLSGFLLAVILPVLSFALTWGIIFIAGRMHYEMAWMVEVVLIYQCISVRGLYEETKLVYQALVRKDMFDARKYLSMVVGRDTQKLNDKEIARATVETIAERSVDGIFSPLLFAAIGGAPLAMACKAVSTLDSMVGYKNEKYAYFGWTSARLDDVCNFVPARLSILFIPVAAFVCRFHSAKSLWIGFRDRVKHTSPNAGHAEAAFAGALDVQLGGTSSDQGVKSEKPVIHPKGKQVDRDDIPNAWKLMVTFSIVTLLLSLLIQFFIHYEY